jgi:chaperonin cofactor prefoldin
MLSPIDALQKMRDEMVMNRRKLIDQLESIQNVQAEIEAIDRAIADEESISRSTGSKPN